MLTTEANTLESETNKDIDWIYLPVNTQHQDLSVCLHDSAFYSIKSDLLNRTITLIFDVCYIREFHKLPEDTLFKFILTEVTSTRVTTFAVWPGKFEVPKNISREEEHRLIKEYQAKWREETCDWNNFESLINKNNTFDIADAEIAIGEFNLTLQLNGRLNNNDYHTAFIRASKLSIQDNRGKVFSLEDLIVLGKDYWQTFSNVKQAIIE
ncbi:MAG: hypothetical protein JNL74_01565 [Fibrobacteres bacterium]|nr:hypothetical protein [Fibrobacterota bacterium]